MAAPTPPFARIVADLRAQIESGRLRPGDRVPSVREIMRRSGVAIATATKVLDTLRNLGLVRAVPGVGTVVADVPASSIVAKPMRREQELGIERIVAAAIAIADTEGIAALSMRRLATDIGVATMALYRHVRSREELVVQMADAVFAAHPPARAGGKWRAQLDALARQQWSAYREHPWLAGILSITRPQLMPHGMAHTEAVLQALAGLELAPQAQLHAAIALIAYVRGMALSLEAEVEAERDSGLDDQAWAAEHDPVFEAVIAAGPFPTLATISSQPGVSLDLESLFTFGLERLLDGYAALGSARSTRRRDKAGTSDPAETTGK